MAVSDTFEVPSGYDDLIHVYGDNYCNLYDALDTASSKRKRKFCLRYFYHELIRRSSRASVPPLRL